jgi:hypothetical protein
MMDIIDIANPAAIMRVYSDRNQGTMYRFPITKQVDPAGLIGGLWLVDCYTYTIATLPEKPNKQKELLPLGASNPSLGPINGFTFLNNGLIGTYNNGLLIKQNNADTLILKRLANSSEPLRGKLTRYNATLYATNRREGEISAIDISDLNSPKLLWKKQITGHPGYAIEYRDMVIVPAGYGGLQLFNKFNGAPIF